MCIPAHKKVCWGEKKGGSYEFMEGAENFTVGQFGQFLTDQLSVKCRNVLKFSIHSAKYGFLNNGADDHFIVIKLQK